MIDLLNAESVAESSPKIPFNIPKLKLALHKIADLYSAWNDKFMPQLEANCDNEAFMYLSINLHILRHVLEDSGFNGSLPDQLADQLDENSTEAHELHCLYQEFVWKIHEMTNELNRRWPELNKPSNNTGNELVRDWISNTRNIISA